MSQKSSKASIVFVHYGRRIPSYLKMNISNVCTQFPEYDVVLLTDHVMNLSFKNFRSMNILVADDFNKARSHLKHPLDFRKGFWATTFLRLTAVSKFASQINQPVIHIESDVVVSQDFPINKFLGLRDTIAFPIVAPGLAVASILYFSDNIIAASFNTFLGQQLEQNPLTTDMKVLEEFRIAFPSAVTILPTGFGDRTHFTDETSSLDYQEIIDNFIYFDGVFDAIDIGFFLFGEDPRNNRGRRRIFKIDNSSFLRIKSYQYTFSKERNFFNLTDGNLVTPIFNLHIHSKDLRAFQPKRFIKLSNKRVSAQANHPYDEFLLRSFIGLSISFISRRLKSFHSK